MRALCANHWKLAGQGLPRGSGLFAGYGSVGRVFACQGSPCTPDTAEATVLRSESTLELAKARGSRWGIESLSLLESHPNTEFERGRDVCSRNIAGPRNQQGDSDRTRTESHVVIRRDAVVGPRWTPENRPVVDGPKPASGRAAPSASVLPRPIVIAQAPCIGRP